MRKDGGYGWVVVFASFMIQFLGLGINFTFGLFFAAIAKEFPEIGKRGPAWIPAIMGASAHAMGPVGSILVNKFNHRTVSVLGSLFACLGFALSYVAPSPFVLYFTVGICAGIGLGLMYLPAVVVLSKYFDQKLASAACIASAGSGSGTFFFEWILVIILADFSWRGGLLICAGIMLLTIPLGLLYRPCEEESSGFISTDSHYEDPDDPWVEEVRTIPTENPRQKSWKKILDFSILNNPLCILFATAEFLTSFGYNVPHIYLPEIEQKLIHSTSNTLLAFIAFPMVITRLSLGYFSDKKWLNRHLLYTVALAVAGIATIASPHLNSIGLLRVYCSIYGISTGIYIGLKSPILASLLGPGKLNESFGIILLVQCTGMLFGAPIAGYLYDLFGNYFGGFYFAGSMFCASAVIVGVIPMVQRSLEDYDSEEEEEKERLLPVVENLKYSTFEQNVHVSVCLSPDT